MEQVFGSRDHQKPRESKKKCPPEKEKFVISFVCRYCYPSKVRGRFNPQIFLWINYVFTKGLLHSPCKGSTIIFAKILNRKLFCFETERFKGSFYQTWTATEEPALRNKGNKTKNLVWLRWAWNRSWLHNTKQFLCRSRSLRILIYMSG